VYKSKEIEMITLIIEIVVGLLLLVGVYAVGENRGKAAKAAERAAIDAYHATIDGYVKNLEAKIPVEVKDDFTKFLALVKATYALWK
jgi:hypothetical protein